MCIQHLFIVRTALAGILCVAAISSVCEYVLINLFNCFMQIYLCTNFVIKQCILFVFWMVALNWFSGSREPKAKCELFHSVMWLSMVMVRACVCSLAQAVSAALVPKWFIGTFHIYRIYDVVSIMVIYHETNQIWIHWASAPLHKHTHIDWNHINSMPFHSIALGKFNYLKLNTL